MAHRGVPCRRLLGCLCAAALISSRAVPAAAGGVDRKDHAWFAGEGRLLRFDYANDFFAGRDRYYTQGLGLAYFDPALRASPLMRALPELPGGESSRGLALRHSGFTPTSLAHDEALIGDRPFAAYLLLGHVLVSRDPGRRLTLTAELEVGIVGQGAGGKWMQTGIHRGLGNLLPRGWDNQIRNDLALGYHARLDKGVYAARAADLGVFADASLGTLHTRAGAGAVGRAGALGGAGGGDARRRVFLFASVEERAVGYDATLQGGLFNRGSPYTLPSSRLARSVWAGDLGLVYDGGGFALEFRRSFLGPEFGGGLSHQWGELSLVSRL